LQYLIETFNSLPSLQLTIIGFGPQEIYLKKIAKSNIKFLGPIANKDMSLYYLILNKIFRIQTYFFQKTLSDKVIDSKSFFSVTKSLFLLLFK
jgi:hypothetical protein